MESQKASRTNEQRHRRHARTNPRQSNTRVLHVRREDPSRIYIFFPQMKLEKRKQTTYMLAAFLEFDFDFILFLKFKSRHFNL